MSTVASPRAFTEPERSLVRWMLEHGRPEATNYLPQLERLSVSPWRCLCGCASLQFHDGALPPPTGGMQILSDYIFGDPGRENGIFVYAQDGRLSGLEVYEMGGEIPTTLPAVPELISFSEPPRASEPL